MKNAATPTPTSSLFYKEPKNFCLSKTKYYDNAIISKNTYF